MVDRNYLEYFKKKVLDVMPMVTKAKTTNKKVQITMR